MSFFQREVDFLASSTPFRRYSITALLLVSSIWIYWYTVQAIKYRVGFLTVNYGAIVLLIDHCRRIASSGSAADANPRPPNYSINGLLR